MYSKRPLFYSVSCVTIGFGLSSIPASVFAQDPNSPRQQADPSDAEIAAVLAADSEPSASNPEIPLETAGSTTALPVPSFNPDISLVTAAAFAHFSDENAQLQTGGHDLVENGFALQFVELSLSAAVDPYFRFDSHFAFSLEGVEVEEAYATTLDLPAGLQARIGHFLTRFGRVNATHPHSWNFADQPLVLGRVFGAEGNRGPGLEVSWLSPLPWYVELIVSTNMANEEGTARSYLGGGELDIRDPRDLQYFAAIKQFFELTDDLSLLWGVSAIFGPSSYGPDYNTQIYGSDAYLRFRPLSGDGFTTVTLTTEWVYRRRESPTTTLEDMTGYAQIMWRMTQRWTVASRYEFGSDTGATDDLDPEWTEDRHRVSAAVAFLPSEFSKLRLQGSVDLPTWLDDPIWAFFANAEFAIGAHGAHAF